MQRTFTFLTTLLCLIFCTAGNVLAQDKTDTVPDSIDPELINLNTSRIPKEFTIAGIKVTGTKRYDEQLLISISGLNVGDKIMIPGGDNFSKAIMNLWRQNLFANVQIYFTKVYEGNVEIEITAEI